MPTNKAISNVDHGNLPSIRNAKLPETYEQAKNHLAKCARIDECKDWSDKSAALASYAKQAKDDTLMKHAMKIQARAIQRAGQLIEAIEPSAPGSGIGRGGAAPSKRKKVASDAGMSVDQMKQAQRVARVPDDEFDALVESDSPPTISELANRGKKSQKMSDEAKARKTTVSALVDLEGILTRCENLDEKYAWSDFYGIVPEYRANENLPGRVQEAIDLLTEIKKCIQRKH